MQSRAKIIAVFLIILILLAFFVLIALWMMITMNPQSQSGAVFALIDQIGGVAMAVMQTLSQAMGWIIDRFWSVAG